MTAMHVHPSFRALLHDDQLRALAASHDSIYILDRELTIRAYNGAYARFGRDNGCPDIEEDYGIGRNLITVLPPAVAKYYVPAYREAIESGERCDYDYDCSSPRGFRRYHQTVYPLRGEALIVANHLLYEMPHAAAVPARGISTRMAGSHNVPAAGRSETGRMQRNGIGWRVSLRRLIHAPRTGTGTTACISTTANCCAVRGTPPLETHELCG